MKYIKKSDFNQIADDVIIQLHANQNPFNSYTVIFPNLITEQWFKIYWTKKTNKVLMNVKFMRMNSFINNLFNDTRLPFITKDRMSLFIIDILKNNPQKYPLISSYFNDDITLYDLSLNLADVFLKYELSECQLEGEYQLLFEEIKNINGYTFLSDVINKNIVFNSKVFVVGFRKIDALYIRGLEKIDNCFIYEIENSKKAIIADEICKALSVEREVEYLFDEVSKILQNDDAVKLSDILVYAPNVSTYESSINKVFSTAGDERFLNIPYSIVSCNKNMSNTGNLIKNLSNILIKGQMTRSDFYKIITNPDVIKVRKLNANKVNEIIKILDRINVYRDNASVGINDFSYAVKRFLLEKLLGPELIDENIVTISDNDYLPYGNISMDDETIEKLVSIIDDISSFRQKYSNHMSLDVLKDELDKWILISDMESSIYYKKAIDILDFIKDNNLNLTTEIIFNVLIDGVQGISQIPSNIFNGITFLNFSENNILTSKYMFFLGMSNNNLPRASLKNPLDEKGIIEPFIDIDSETLIFLHANSNTKYFYSYVSIDLKSGEEYSLTSLLVDNNKEKICYNLSETRSYSLLWSKSEVNKRKYNDSLINESCNKPDKIPFYNKELPREVKYTELSELLEEGLSAKMKKLFAEDDDILDKANKSFEPIKLDALNASFIKKSLLRLMLDKKTSYLDSKDIKYILYKNKLNHSIPFNYDISNELKETQNYFALFGSDYQIIEPFECCIKNELGDWTIKVSDEFVYAMSLEENKKVLSFFEIRVKDYSDASSLTRAYIISLAYIAKNGMDEEYYVNLNERNNEKKKYGPISKTKAIEILNNIYALFVDFSNVFYSPLNNWDEKDYLKVRKSTYNNWKFFDDANLVDKRYDLGFDASSFEQKWKYYQAFVKENILYAKEK